MKPVRKKYVASTARVPKGPVDNPVDKSQQEGHIRSVRLADEDVDDESAEASLPHYSKYAKPLIGFAQGGRLQAVERPQPYRPATVQQ